MTRVARTLVAVIAFFSGAGALAASGPPRSARRPAIFALHVGVNAPPEGSTLSQLRYADDDAARFFAFSRLFAVQTVLATVLDEESQHRHASLARHSILPTRWALEQALERLREQMQRARDQGREVMFYFSYAGHGLELAGETRLTLYDGVVGRAWLLAQLGRLPADRIHLFVDACNAEGVVRGRGVITREVDARSRRLLPREREALLNDKALVRLPNVGALVAATRGAEAHEWSRLQSGVFTHQVLSALSGAADVNDDGEIAYSEISAFVAAANRSIRDRRAAVVLRALPPRMDRNAPIFALTWVSNPAGLRSQPGLKLGHFHIESDRGLRLVDAHPAPEMGFMLLLPPAQRLWLRNKTHEASFVSVAGKTLDLSQLSLRRRDGQALAARGSLDQSLERDLFATPFGPDYYRGWVDHHGWVSVRFAPQVPMSDRSAVHDARTTPRRGSMAPAVMSLTVAAVAAAACTALSVLAVNADNAVAGTQLQREASEARDRFELYRGLAIGSGVAALGLAGLTLWLWPKRAPVVHPEIDRQMAGLTVTSAW